MKQSLASHGQGGRKKFFSLLTAALCLLLLTACANEPGAARSATPTAADVQSDNGRSEAKKELQGNVIVGEKQVRLASGLGTQVNRKRKLLVAGGLQGVARRELARGRGEPEPAPVATDLVAGITERLLLGTAHPRGRHAGR